VRFDKEAITWDEKPRRVELANAVIHYIYNDTKNKKILDFGCGTGLVSLGLDAEVLGVDLSCEMVNVFNHKAQKLNKQAKAICDDIDNIKEKFDVIVANMVFHHIENIENTLKILHSKLTKDGIVFISDLYLEDGSFHDKGNDDVAHFGFDKDDFKSKYFDLLDFCKIYTIKKHKNFDVYIWKLQKK